MKSILLFVMICSSQFGFSNSIENIIQNKADSSSWNESNRKHGFYIEPWLFGRVVTLGYSYDFLSRDRFIMTASAGFGMNFKFTNPNTGFYVPIGIQAKYQLKKRLYVSTGVLNFSYINYWANFSEEGKDCTGLWSCPPDEAPFMLMPFLGGSYEFKRFSIEPRVYFSFFAWWEKVYPLPALRLKLKL
ncbi:MAG: hypothetical protein ACI8ZM_000428 [Crocinitomix sp.]|jgi:hypothetical protein